ncbi:unnamed protein product [Caenorhabditis auriculariae]|uniref:Uncharacterized protein n=1 Tax=Caenorhabditis auriculariae TaxID=2777116 RepID=A0A8S1HK52_9PELO|nr:unnamed protein product [Caenorhabditis auriculariae]
MRIIHFTFGFVCRHQQRMFTNQRLGAKGLLLIYSHLLAPPSSQFATAPSKVASMLVALVLLAGVPAAMALTCWENDRAKEAYEVSNPNWHYCAYIPGENGQESKVFGIGSEEDSLVPYDTTFQQTDSIYKVLTVCLYEKYDMTKLGGRFKAAEYLFRCVCNYDLCNAPSNFPQYLKQQRERP